MELDDSLDPETKGRIRQFCRLLISYNDFKHAIDVAAYILDENLHERKRGESRMLLEALNCAMIVSYCRPFSGSDKKTAEKVPDLPGKFLRVLNTQEREVHETAMKDRNTLLAHSDSQAWDVRPTILDTGASKILLPLSDDTRAPFTREATTTLKSAAYKLQEAVFAERMNWEPKLVEHFEVIRFDDEELEAIKKKFIGKGNG
jgi:hypothetical protein